MGSTPINHSPSDRDWRSRTAADDDDRDDSGRQSVTQNFRGRAGEEVYVWISQWRWVIFSENICIFLLFDQQCWTEREIAWKEWCGLRERCVIRYRRSWILINGLLITINLAGSWFSEQEDNCLVSLPPARWSTSLLILLILPKFPKSSQVASSHKLINILCGRRHSQTKRQVPSAVSVGGPRK